MFVNDDYDGKKHEDDSGMPIGGYCSPGDTSCQSHGTSMLGAVAGAKLGIAKKVKPVLVRMPRKYQTGAGASPQNFLEGVYAVDDAITENSRETQAILSLSWYYDFQGYSAQVGEHLTESAYEIWKFRLYSVLKSLIRKGVFVVTGTGNRRVVRSCCAS